MDLLSLLAERGRVADEFRATVTYVAMLRSHLVRKDLSDETRSDLLPVIEEEAGESRRLSERLLQLDAAILKMQAVPEAPSRVGPLDLAPVVF